MALSKPLIISCNFIKQNTVVDINMSNDVIDPQIWEAQESEIQSLLGTHLYNKILSGITNGNLSGYYKTLVDTKISMCLVYYTLAYGVPFWVYEFGNKGIAKKTSTNSVPIEKMDIDYLVETFKKRAEDYATKIVSFINANLSKFPEYLQNGEGDISPEKDNVFSCPIAFGKDYPTNQELNYLNDITLFSKDEDES